LEEFWQGESLPSDYAAGREKWGSLGSLLKLHTLTGEMDQGCGEEDLLLRRQSITESKVELDEKRAEVSVLYASES
jgi:hypothetical protein